MKKIYLMLIGMCLAFPMLSAGAEKGADGFREVELSPSDGKLTELLARETQKAKALKLVPFVQFHADWCGPCRRLHASMEDPLMVDAFKGTYIIRLNSDAWKDSVKEAGFAIAGIPAFFALDEKGKPTGKEINGGAWGKDIPENMAPPLKKFFTENSSGLKKASGK